MSLKKVCDHCGAIDDKAKCWYRVGKLPRTVYGSSTVEFKIEKDFCSVKCVTDGVMDLETTKM